jgi:hypothetical protein
MMSRVFCKNCVYLRKAQLPPRPDRPKWGASPLITKSDEEAFDKLQEMQQAEVDLWSERKTFSSEPHFFDWCAHWSDKATSEAPPDAHGDRPYLYSLTDYHNEHHNCSAYRARSDAVPSQDDE